MIFRKTVDSVVATFNKSVAALELIETEQTEYAISKRVEADAANAVAATAELEAQRAFSVADKIRELVS